MIMMMIIIIIVVEVMIMMMMMMMTTMTLKNAIPEFLQMRCFRILFKNLFTAPRTVSNTYAHVASAQSRANTSGVYHMRHVLRYMVRSDSKMLHRFPDYAEVPTLPFWAEDLPLYVISPVLPFRSQNLPLTKTQNLPLVLSVSKLSRDHLFH